VTLIKCNLTISQPRGRGQKGQGCSQGQSFRKGRCQGDTATCWQAVSLQAASVDSGWCFSKPGQVMFSGEIYYY